VFTDYVADGVQFSRGAGHGNCAMIGIEPQVRLPNRFVTGTA